MYIKNRLHITNINIGEQGYPITTHYNYIFIFVNDYNDIIHNCARLIMFVVTFGYTLHVVITKYGIEISLQIAALYWCI